MKILIDAGHGGSDSGAVNPKTKQREDRTNFNVTLMLAGLLTEAGYEVELMRKRHDESISVNDRMSRIKKAKPDLFISIHHNSSGNGKAKGGEVLAQVKCGKSDKFAQFIIDEWKKNGRPVRGIRHVWNSAGNADYYGVLRAAASAGVVGVITEYAFIDNDDDLKSINSYRVQMEEAFALFDAIDAYA